MRPLLLLALAPLALALPPAASSAAAPGPAAAQQRTDARLPGAGQRGGQRGPGAGRKDAARGSRGGGALPPTPEQLELAETYFLVADHDGNGWISWREASESLRLDKIRFGLYDANGDAMIQPAEFRASYLKALERMGAYPPPIPRAGSEGASLLAAARAREAEPLAPERKAGSVLELFGAVREREDDRANLPLPPHITGPVDVFHRLDVDRDGQVTESDLDRLQRPVQLLVRMNTVLASLDENGDGGISRDEFYASMR